ncbi:MAG: hypothetical protein ILM98_13465 [Kiritimatiellae bacterium]|nr:hypothetical protein [Kiritimatiellia bacterium]
MKCNYTKQIRNAVSLCAVGVMSLALFGEAQTASADTYIVAPMADTYLQSDGTQAIDTGWFPSDRTKVVIDYEAVWSDANAYVFGADGTPMMALWSKANANLVYRNPAGSHVNLGVAATDGTRQIVTIDYLETTATVADADGTVLSTVQIMGVEPETNTVSMSVFAFHTSRNAYAYPLTGKIYSMQIYDDGTLVRDFIPYGFNSSTGLYDRVNGRVHENVMSGGNPFVIGTRYDDDAYVRGDSVNKVFIDTGFEPRPTTKVQIDFALMSADNNSRVFGTYTGSGLNMSLQVTGQYIAYSMRDGTGNMHLTNSVTGRYGLAHDGNRHVFTLDANEALMTSADGSVTNGITSEVATRTLAGGNNLYVLGTSVNAQKKGTYPCDVKVYGMKIWDNGTLVRDFVPRIVNGVAGLWDSENSEFHGKTSDSVGNVRYGGPIESDFVPAFTVNPQSGEIPVEGSVTLSAKAPGAIGYQWFLNGEIIEGANSSTVVDGVLESTLVVNWTKDTRLVRKYKCIAFFDVFGYAESTEAVLTNAPAATVIIMK